MFVVHMSTCHIAVDVEYSKKIVSDRKGDAFGYSLATSNHKLVVGAPWDDNYHVSVMVNGGVRVKGPEYGALFGWCVDLNQDFIVVGDSGEDGIGVHVYQSYSPYNLMARIPIDGNVYSIVISDDNTIAVSHDDFSDKWLTIYQYGGSSTWNIAEKFKLDAIGYPLAVYGDVIVVGNTEATHLKVFN